MASDKDTALVGYIPSDEENGYYAVRVFRNMNEALTWKYADDSDRQDEDLSRPRVIQREVKSSERYASAVEFERQYALICDAAKCGIDPLEYAATLAQNERDAARDRSDYS